MSNFMEVGIFRTDLDCWRLTLNKVYYVTMTALLLSSVCVKFLGPCYFIKFVFIGKLGMKYDITVSELTPPLSFRLIPLKIEKLVRKWTLSPKRKNSVTIWNTDDVTSFFPDFGDNLRHTCTLPNLVPIDLFGVAFCIPS